MRHSSRVLFLTVFFVSGRSWASFGQTGNSEEMTCGAPNQPSASGTSRGEWTVAGYLGGARTGSSPLTISQPSLGNLLRFDAVHLEGRSLQGPLYYGFRGGYFLHRLKLGLEAEFIHLKVYADTTRQVQASGIRLGTPIDRIITLRDIVEQYSISHGVNLLLFNLAGRYSTAPEMAMIGFCSPDVSARVLRFLIPRAPLTDTTRSSTRRDALVGSWPGESNCTCGGVCMPSSSTSSRGPTREEVFTSGTPIPFYGLNTESLASTTTLAAREKTGRPDRPLRHRSRSHFSSRRVFDVFVVDFDHHEDAKKPARSESAKKS
jgi:hypothetical protein